MKAVRASAWLAIFVATALTVVCAVAAFYAVRGHRPPVELSDVVPFLSIALLALGAVRGLRDGDDRYLILAWAWLAGTWLPGMFLKSPEPAYVHNAPAGPTRALLYEAWQYGLRARFFWEAVYSTFAVVGLLLALRARRRDV